MQCPSCNLDQPAGNRFCEDCGAAMSGDAPAAVVTSRCTCGAIVPPNDVEEFCPRCGVEHRPDAADHLEVSLSEHLAAVSDRGPVRHRNEDFFAIGSVTGSDVLVVCDGVSRSQQSDRAARAAATIVRDELLKTVTRSSDTTAAIVAAIRSADIAVRSLPAISSYPGDPAETTVVAAVRENSVVTIGWLGDSRAYWVDSGGMKQITRDHSWFNDAVDSGEYTAEQAAVHPHAHGITRTLGGPTGPDGPDEPSVLRIEIGRDVSPPGRLMLCTDGFWNAYNDDQECHDFVSAAFAKEVDALTLARGLVDSACKRGGRDNITIAVLTIPPFRGIPESRAV